MAKFQYKAVNLGGKASMAYSKGRIAAPWYPCSAPSHSIRLEITEVKASGGLTRRLAAQRYP